jgi:hypothetical protein
MFDIRNCAILNLLDLFYILSDSLTVRLASWPNYQESGEYAKLELFQIFQECQRHI